MADHRICSIEGCGNPYLASGLCSMHYQRRRKTGSLGGAETKRPQRIRGKCSVEGCETPHLSNGYCSKHLDKFKKYGDPLAGREADEPMNFLINVVLPYKGEECLLWPYSGNGNGYGKIFYSGKRRYVHRIVCEEQNGRPPSSIHEAAHSCGNGHLGCVARSHLSWKTREENQSDKLVHGTHQNGERNHMAKLDEAAILEIRALEGVMSQKLIGERFGIHQVHVSRILRGKRWTWLE